MNVFIAFTPFAATLLLGFGACNVGPRESAGREDAPGQGRGASSPVFVDVPASNAWDEDICVSTHGETFPAQLERLDANTARVWWLADTGAGEHPTVELKPGETCEAQPFTWEHDGPESSILLRNGKPVIGYEHPVFSADRIEETKKPFHHVYDPDGRGPITKGLGGLYPHHRGIFFGYNAIRIGAASDLIDIWHAAHGERSEHVEVLEEFAGSVMGGHRVRILWIDRDGEPFIEETRDVRAFVQTGDAVLIDFASVLRSLGGHITLDGDRHHAGVQFRAAQEVADHPEATRFVRPSTWAHLPADEEVDEPEAVDLPWNAMQFAIAGRSYTVAYLSHPANPGRGKMSERKYGRFGEFFRYELTPEQPLRVRYRFWISADPAAGRDEVELRYAQFADPPQPRLTR